MKNLQKIALASASFSLLFTACQDVIDIDLNAAAPRIVIEAELTDEAKKHVVRIERTVNFDEPNDYPDVSGALVTISDGALIDTLREVAPGRYETQKLQKGEPGRTYFLRVETGGEVFEAESKMAEKVPFDSLYQSSLSAPGAGQTTVLVPEYFDPAGFGNYFRFVAWRNGQKMNDINVRDDRNSDGIRASRPIFLLSEELKTGDEMTVEMQAIDRAVYKYFIALGGSGGPNDSATPANPPSNLTGGALGFFSAHPSQRRTWTVR